MCKAMEEMRAEAELKACQEKMREIARNLLRMNTMSHAQISEATGLTVSQVEELAGEALI